MIFSRLFKKQSESKKDKQENLSLVMPDNDKRNEAQQGAEQIDDELVAVITAAIQSSIGYDPHNRLVVKSIVRTGQSTPVWNRTGRLDRLDKKI